MLNPALSFLFAVNEKATCAAGGQLAGLVGGELITDVDFACRHTIARSDRV